MPSLRPRPLGPLLMTFLLGVLGCRPTEDPRPGDAPALEPAPPAPVVAVLGPHGPPPAGGTWQAVPPGLVEYGPQGSGEGERALYLRFSEPMQRDDEAPGIPVFETTPNVAGKLRWIDAYRLDYVFTERPPPASRVEIRVKGTPLTETGKTVDVDVGWTIETEAPWVDIKEREDERLGDPGDDQGRRLRHWKTPFIVELKPLVHPETLRKYLTVTATPRKGGPATPVRYRLRVPRKGDLDAYYPSRVGRGIRVPRVRQARPRVGPKPMPLPKEWKWGTLLLEPVGHWPADSIISAKVDGDYRTSFGPVTLGRDVGAELVTIEGLDVKLSCDVDHGDGCGPGSISVELDGPVAINRLRKIQIEPRPKGFRVKRPRWNPDDQFGAELRGRFQEGTTYRVTVPTSVQDAWGHRPPAPVVFEAKFVPPAPEVALSSSRGTLRADDARTVGLETRWVQQVRLRAAVLTDQQLAGQWLRDVDEFELPPDPVRSVDRLIDLSPSKEYGWSSIAIDLADISGGERRPVVVVVEPTELMPQADGRPAPEAARGLWQQTDLGAVAVVSPSRSMARVHALSDGAPRPNVEVDLFRGTRSVPAKFLRDLGQTNARGVIELPKATTLPKRGLLRFADGDDRYMLRVGQHRDPQQRWRAWYGRYAYEDKPALLHELVTERPLYRPGDRVHVVGWTAISDSQSPAGLRPLPAETRVLLELLDNDGDTVDREEVATSAHGKYWATLALPAEGRLGRYGVRATIDEDSATKSITVRDFKTPSFSVSVDSTEGDVLHGATIETRVSASYYFGGEVPVRSFTPVVKCHAASYRPPGLEWAWSAARLDDDERRKYRATLAERHERDPQARGRATVFAVADTLDKSHPYRCTTSVAVSDESLEEVGGESSVMVHPEGYLFARRPPSWLRAGARLSVPVRVVDFTGTRKGGVEAVVKIERENWVDTDSGWVSEITPVRTCRLKTTATGEDATCEITPKEGRHRISVSAAGDGAPQGTVELSSWVGAKRRRRSRPTTAPLELELSPEDPRPGDTAEVRVRSTYANGEGLLVLAAGGLRRAEPFSLKDGKATLTVEVDEAWVPALSVRATLITPGATRATPHVLQDELVVRVGNEGRRLNVQVRPPAEATPNAEVEIPVTLADAAGAPVGGHVALWAVDEAVLSLKEPKLPDLVERFTRRRPERASIEHDYELLRLPYLPRGDPYLLTGGGGTGSGYGRGSGAGFGGRGSRVPRVRTNTARERFETTPIFIGDVEVPASGTATVRGRMPENLTTFRVTAIASAPLPDHEGVGRFGVAEERIRVTVPLALRTILPRVLRPGDQVQLAAMVDNRTGPAGTVAVSLKLHDAEGVVTRISPARQRVAIEAGGQVRVPFDMRALGPGTPTVELSAELTPTDGTPPLSDTMKVPMPVTVERTLVRRSAVYGQLDDDEAVAVAVEGPKNATGVRVETSLDGTLLGGLDDVAAGLVLYPYGCLEQTASRMVPLLALGRLDEHHLPPNTDVDQFVQAGITRLRSMQTSQGGFSYWPGQYYPHVYASAYGLWVLEQVAAADYPVPSRMLDGARRYVNKQVRAWAEREVTRLHDDVPMALAVHALAASDRMPAAALDRLVEHWDTLPAFARGLAVLAMAEAAPDDPRLPALLDALGREVDSQGAVAHVRRRSDRYLQYFDSPARTDAIVLWALLTARPDDPRVVPLARGLTVERGGGLRNTQERAYGLLALAEYAEHYEPDDPSFLAHVWMGPQPRPGVRFDALDAPAILMEAPLAQLGAATEPPRVTLRRQGRGRAYYRVGMRWSPSEPPRTPVAAGIAVNATLRNADGEITDGTVIAPGAPVALDLTLNADSHLDYVVLEVPLPAGLEAIDTSIGRGRGAMTLGGVSSWWVAHKELRADRALLFVDRLPPGEQRHTIHLRAATPGEFVMPPPHAEAMYLPEIHGHGISRRIHVAPPSG